MPDQDIALSVRKIIAHACTRIARRAFGLARTRRNKVTAIHKANNFALLDWLFLREVRAVDDDYPDVGLDEMIVDATAAMLVRDLARFHVLCTTNFPRDILSDLAAGLSGSIGLTGSVNVGDQHGCAQAQRGSAPDIVGQEKTCPTSLILSASMLLDWRGECHGRADLCSAAAAINIPVDQTLADPATRTADVSGTLGTRAFAEAVTAALIS